MTKPKNRYELTRCSLNTSILLKKAGYAKGCDHAWMKVCRVRDKIKKLHPDLTDDGYYDLQKTQGGPYKRSEVYGTYTEPVKVWSRNDIDDEDYIICSQPEILDAMDFMEKKGFKIIIVPECSGDILKKNFAFCVSVWDFKNSPYQSVDLKKTFLKYSKAMDAGLEKALEMYLKNRDENE